MPYIVDFENVSTVGLESSPVADALAGLRANEARYYKNKYSHDFTVSPASEAPKALDLVTRVLADERGLVIAARPSRRRPSRWRASGWPTCSTSPVWPST